VALPPTPSSAEVKERVQLYLYSTSGPSWPLKDEVYFYLHTKPFTVTPLRTYCSPCRGKKLE